MHGSEIASTDEMKKVKYCFELIRKKKQNLLFSFSKQYEEISASMCRNELQSIR